jgi:hypothetical protein
MSNQVILDLDGLFATQSYDDCLKLCEELGLIEMAKHGDHAYGRVTQKGVNVLCTLLQMANNAQEPSNRLELS